ncbi:MAG: hypothetical protein KatS3mg076_1432 [Candidatus Binatia bacterium]|nr:MAG: hypothetical protein KatS3mg076_1432 [Candidatus Binatia bacterium]
MWRSPVARWALYLALGTAAAWSPPGRGWPFLFDAWLWTGLRDVVTGDFWKLPISVSVAMAAADFLARHAPRLEIPVRRLALFVLSVGVCSGLFFWVFRVRFWLGDLARLEDWPLPWWRIEAAEPLGALTWAAVEHGANALGISRTSAHQLVSVVAGGTALGGAFLLSRDLHREWPYFLAMFASSGFLVLFCGYPEKGTPKALAVLVWYLWAASRAWREGSRAWLFLSSLFLSVAALLHGSALCALGGHLYGVWKHRSPRAVLSAALGFFLPLACVGAYVLSGAPVSGGAWGNIAAPWQWFDRYCVTNCGYEFWSLDHLLDIVNCLLVLAPVAVLFWPQAWIRSRDTASRALGITALGGLFLSVVWFPVYGYYADWDIFAVTPLLVTAHVLSVAARDLPPSALRRLAAAWVVGSAAHALSWWRYFRLGL